jgi:hypothetical protein
LPWIWERKKNIFWFAVVMDMGMVDILVFFQFSKV